MRFGKFNGPKNNCSKGHEDIGGGLPKSRMGVSKFHFYFLVGHKIIGISYSGVTKSDFRESQKNSDMLNRGGGSYRIADKICPLFEDPTVII